MEKVLIEWWESFRPGEWSLEEHLQNPTINTRTIREANLAAYIAGQIERDQSSIPKPEELPLQRVIPALPFYCETCGSKFSQKPETEYCPICKYYSLRGNAV